MDSERRKEITSVKEKRRHVRVEIMGEVKFETLQEPKLKDTGLIYDIGIGGVSIIMPESLRQGTSLGLEFDFADGLGPFIVSGTVVWQDRFGQGKGKLFEGWYRTGIIFNNMTKEMIQRVFRFLYNHVQRSKD